jgi:hypothetical protein
MARALTISRTTVSADARDAFLDRARARKAYYAKANVKYWVFEEPTLRGAFVEFAEAADEGTLEKAHAASPDAPAGANRIYREVEGL